MSYWREVVEGSDYHLKSQEWEDLLSELEELQAGAASRDAYIERLETGLLQVRKALCGDIHNTDDLLDLIASRDAEIQRLQFALADAESLELGTAERCDQLRAELAAEQANNTRLRDFIASAQVSSGVCCCGEAMDGHSSPMSCGHSPVDMWDHAVEKLLHAPSDTSTPKQSLADYRNKVIEECAKRAEAYAYMSQNFNALAEELRAMKEQP